MFVPPKVILVPTDFSGFSDNALQYALDIAVQHGATVYVLNVRERKVYSDHTVTMELIESMEKRRIESAQHELLEELNKFPLSKNVPVLPIVRIGLDYEEILNLEDELGVNLIVIGSHGRTGAMALLMGSVAEKVARNAKCPVLVVRTAG